MKKTIGAISLYGSKREIEAAEEALNVAMLWNSLPDEHNQELNDCIKKLKALVIIAADQAFGAPEKSR